AGGGVAGGGAAGGGAAGGGADGHRLIDDYARWAPALDRFTPVQVATEILVNIPDPVLSNRDLVGLAGEPVVYATWLDAVVLDDENRPWLMFHRVGSTPPVDPELLTLDEAALTDCWAWEELNLSPQMAGAVFTDVCTASMVGGGDAGLSGGTGGDAAGGTGGDHAGVGGFRRREVRYSREELAGAGRQLATEALDMVDAGLPLYPSPSPSHCAGCQFRAPCLAVRAGQDPVPLLAAGYEHRPEAELVEGRLGGRTWSIGRGARPPRFG
ncbi:MAG: hypothetical protein ACRDY0_12990, partial [Acidimicrobiales bacterium]